MRIVEAGAQRRPQKPEEKPIDIALVKAIIDACPEKSIPDPLGNGRLSSFQEDQALLRSAIDLDLVPQLVARFNEGEILILLDYLRDGRKSDDEENDEAEDESNIEGLLNSFSIEMAKLAASKEKS